jgi:hypothetical protein
VIESEISEINSAVRARRQPLHLRRPDCLGISPA